MSGARHERASELLLRAFELPRDQREAFVAGEAGDDPALRDEVMALLAADVESTGFLSRGALAGAAAEVVGEADAPPSIPGFRLIGRIGAGGMGVVYEAEQERPSRRVALKVMRPGLGSPAALARFEREAELLARVEHEGVARLYEAGVFHAPGGARPYLAMELVRGEPITAYARERRLGLRDRLGLLAAVADGVHHAHMKGVIHRDLKPANVLVGEDGSGVARPKVLDFGVARALDADASGPAGTMTGEIIGTLATMSPEQLAGRPGDVDARADIYAIGAIGYELLAGRPAFDAVGRPLAEAARMIAETDPPRLGSIDRRLLGDVETIIATAMDRDRDRRYPAASMLAADLRRRLRGEPITARPPSAWYQIGKLIGRHRLASGVIAASLVLLVGALAMVAVALDRSREAARSATLEAGRARGGRDFLIGLLRAPDPQRAGVDARVVDVLEAAADDLDALAGDPPVYAEIAGAIGASYFQLGVLGEAERHYRAALDAATSEPRSPRGVVASIEGDLGVVLMNLDRLGESDAVLASALATKRDLFGDDDERTLTTMINLSNLRRRQGDMAGAAVLLRDALAAADRVHGPVSPQTLAAANNLAALESTRGRLDEAAALYARVMAGCERAFGAEDPRTLVTVANLGALALKRDDPARAESLLRRSLAGRRAILPPAHGQLARNMVNLSEAVRRLGRPAEARVLADDGAAMYVALGLAGTADELTARHQVALVLLDSGEAERAEAVVAGIIGRGPDVLDPGHWRLDHWRTTHARCLAALGRGDEAAAILAESVPRLVEALGPDSPVTAEAQRALDEVRRRRRRSGAIESGGAGGVAVRPRCRPAPSLPNRADCRSRLVADRVSIRPVPGWDGPASEGDC